MKYKKYLLGLAVLSSTLAVGCNRSSSTSDSTTETTQQQMDRTETAVSNAAQDMEAYTFAQKEQFIATMETELATINRNIDELAERVERSGAETKASVTPRLNELRHQADLLENQIDDVKDTNETNWDRAKAATRETFDNLKNNFADARQWVSDKIEP